jgi:hypothetical protein
MRNSVIAWPSASAAPEIAVVISASAMIFFICGLSLIGRHLAKRCGVKDKS